MFDPWFMTGTKLVQICETMLQNEAQVNLYTRQSNHRLIHVSFSNTI